MPSLSTTPRGLETLHEESSGSDNGNRVRRASYRDHPPSRRRHARSSSAAKPEDTRHLDDELFQRRSSKRPARTSSTPQSKSSVTYAAEKEPSGFIPRLKSILEGKDPEIVAQQRKAYAGSRRQQYTAQPRSPRNKDGGIDRPRRSSSIRPQDRIARKRLMSPSMISVISALTGASSSSSSNSTVTQSNYSRSDDSARQRKPSSSSSSSSSRRRRRKVYSDEGSERRYKSSNPSQESVNVFNYLASSQSDLAVADPAWQSESSSASSSEEDEDPDVSPTDATYSSPATSHSAESQKWSYQDRPHSDSGISMRGSSPESNHGRPSSSQQHQLSIDMTRTASDGESRASGQSSPSSHHSQPYTPPYLYDSTLVRPDVPPPAPMAPGGQIPAIDPNYHPQPHHGYLRSASLDSLATRLSARAPPPSSVIESRHGPEYETSTIVPIYRRFEFLHNRLLLHLQDEVAELEAQLRHLDEAIARRAAMRENEEELRVGLEVGELEYRRTELLGHVFMKMGQYHQALSTYSTITTTHPPATTEDISSHRALAASISPPPHLPHLANSPSSSSLINTNINTSTPSSTTSSTTPNISHDLLRISAPQDHHVPSTSLVHVQNQSSHPPSTTPASQNPATPSLRTALLAPPAALLVAALVFSNAKSLTMKIIVLLLGGAAGVFAWLRTGHFVRSQEGTRGVADQTLRLEGWERLLVAVLYAGVVGVVVGS